MTTVYTEYELKNALERGEKKVLCKGELGRKLAAEIEKCKKKKRNLGIAAAGAVALGVAAAPFTGGASLIPGVAAGLTIGTVTITIGELALILGAALAGIAILKNKNVKLKMTSAGVELTVISK